MRRRRDECQAFLPAAAWSAVLAAVLLWPLHHAGYPLGRDMVFTPRQPLSWSSLGLGPAAPRAVPVDALVSISSKLLGGAVVGRVALVLPLVAAGIGVAVILGRERRAGGLVAAGVVIWNPYVVERLGLGDWSLLWAYGAMPWIVVCATRARRGASIGPLLVCVAAASVTPTGGVTALVAATVLAWPERPRAVRRLDRWARMTAAAIALQLPWLVPGLVGGSATTGDPAGVSAFASRAEYWGGVLLSLLGGGGIWNADVMPSSRSGALAYVSLVLTGAAIVLGLRGAVAHLGRVTTERILGLGLAGLVLSWWSSVPVGAAMLRVLVSDVPGAGLLRDAQKWLMPYVLVVAVLCGFAAARVVALGRWRHLAAAAAMVLPVLLLPDGASTLKPTLDPVRYPADWSWAARAVDRHGAVLVLPFQPYRTFSWAPGRPLLDPAPRLLPGTVIVSDRLSVSGVMLQGESRTVDAVAKALDAGPRMGADLARAGVGWVLVERGTPGAVPSLAGLRLVRESADLELYRVPDPVTAVGPSGTRLSAVLAADAIAVIALLSGLLTELTRRLLWYRRGRSHPNFGGMQ